VVEEQDQEQVLMLVAVVEPVVLESINLLLLLTQPVLTTVIQVEQK
jgi:hypothetical protein